MMTILVVYFYFWDQWQKTFGICAWCVSITASRWNLCYGLCEMESAISCACASICIALNKILNCMNFKTNRLTSFMTLFDFAVCSCIMETSTNLSIRKWLAHLPTAALTSGRLEQLGPFRERLYPSWPFFRCWGHWKKWLFAVLKNTHSLNLRYTHCQ